MQKVKKPLSLFLAILFVVSSVCGTVISFYTQAEDTTVSEVVEEAEESFLEEEDVVSEDIVISDAEEETSAEDTTAEEGDEVTEVEEEDVSSAETIEDDTSLADDVNEALLAESEETTDETIVDVSTEEVETDTAEDVVAEEETEADTMAAIVSEAEEEAEDVPVSENVTENDTEDSDASEESVSAENTLAEEVEELENASEEEAETKSVSDSGVASKRIYTYSDDKISVTVVADDASDIPDEAELVVTQLSDTDEYLDLLQENNSSFVYSDDNTILYDISLLLDGVEIEPDDTVSVIVKLSDELLDTIGAETMLGTATNHFVENGKDIELEEMGSSTSSDLISFETDSFSVYATTYYATLVTSAIEVDLSDTDLSSYTHGYCYIQTINGEWAFCLSPGAASSSSAKLYYYDSYSLSSSIKAAYAYFADFYEKGGMSYLRHAYTQAYIWCVVEGLSSSSYEAIIDAILEAYEDAGYDVSLAEIDAASLWTTITNYDYSGYTFYVYRGNDNDNYQYLVTTASFTPSYETYVKLTKSSSSGSSYSLAGALYRVTIDGSNYYFVTSADGTGYVATTSGTGSLSATYNGTTYISTGSSTLTIDLGTSTSCSYTVTELVAPGNGKYELNSGSDSGTLTAGTTTTLSGGVLEDDDTEYETYVKLTKSSASDSSYSLAGALYRVTIDGSNYYFVTSADGTGYVATTSGTGSLSATYNGTTYISTGSSTLTIDLGTSTSCSYTVKELVEPGNGKYALNSGSDSGTLTAGTTTTLSGGVLEDELATGYLKLTKYSDDGDYSFAGALYYVYDSSGSLQGRFVVAANGTGYVATTSGTGSLSVTYNGTTYISTGSSSMELDEGTYTVVEKVAPGNGAYSLSDEELTITVTAGSTVTIECEDELAPYPVSVKKVSSITESYIMDNENYSLEGAVYRVYTDSACTTRATDYYGSSITLTTDEDGNTNEVYLTYGETYYIKEYIASTGYKIDETVYKITVSADEDDNVITSTEVPAYGYLDLVKSSKIEDITDDNGCYDLEGTTYIVYTDKSCTTQAVDYYGNNAYFVCDSDGNADVLTMPLGTYYVAESTTGTGYVYESANYSSSSDTSHTISSSNNVYTVTVYEDETTWVNGTSGVSDMPIYDPRSLLLTKENAEGDDADLSGAVYKIEYFDNYECSGTATRTWYFETVADGSLYFDEDYLASGYDSDDLYYDYSGVQAVIPLGSIRITEIVAPFGFLLDETSYTAVISTEESSVFFEYENLADNTHCEYPVRDNLMIYKVDTDGEALAYIPFLITRTYTDSSGNEITQSQIIVTDEHGWYSSINRELTVDNVNVLDVDTYVDGLEFTGTYEELVAAAEYNIWFGNTSLIEDGVEGVLLYGEYTVQELRCEANEGQTLVSKTFTVDEYDEDGNVKTTESEIETIYVSMVDIDVLIDTIASNPITEDNIVYASEEASVRDTIEIDNLNSNFDYKVLLQFVDEDENIVGSGYSDEFSTDTTGNVVTIDVDLTIDTSAFTDGGTITAFVYLYQEIDGDWYYVAEHTEIDDEDEQLYIPSMTTEAIDTATGDHVGVVGTSTILDTVSYENLNVGYTFKLVETVVDEDGNEYGNAEQVFTVHADTAINRLLGYYLPSDSIEMPEITVETTEGLTLYVNEVLYLMTADDDGNIIYTEVLTHDSVSREDEDQMIWYPEIVTHAVNIETADHVGSSTIVDTTQLSNLVVGEEYTVVGYVVYEEDYTDEDGVVHEAGEIITDEISEIITASATVETIELDFDIDIDLSGATVVVYERLEHNDVVVDTHTDITNFAQSIYYPAIGTSAADTLTNDNVGAYVEDDTIIDTVAFENLLPGSYELVGKLVFQSSETVFSEEQTIVLTINSDGTASVDNEDETVTITSFDVSADGTVTMTFPGIDATTLSGTTLVVYEKLYRIHKDCDTCWTTYEDVPSESILVAEHTEIFDVEQSIHYPAIDTVAYDMNTGDHVGTVWAKVFAWISSLIGSDDVDNNGIDDDVQQNIVDTVSLSNLLVGEEYVLTGVVVDANTGEAISVDENEITQTATFVVTETGFELASGNAENFVLSSVYEDGVSVDGSLDLVFSLASYELEENTTLVIYEYLYHNGVLVGEHTTIDDEDQMIWYPEIVTHAVNIETADHVGSSTIVDTTQLSNLVVGEEYTVVGYVVYEEDYTDEDGVVHEAGEIITDEVSQTITAENTSEIIELNFNIEQELSGATVIVYEKLFHNDVVVDAHTDITNFAQSIYYPAISTSAIDTLTEDTVGAYTEDDVIVDTVTFENLLPGSYELVGTLMVQSTELTYSEESQSIILTINEDGTATIDDENETIEITAFDISADGTVTMTFSNIDATTLSGTTLVVYERLYRIHKDCEDCWTTYDAVPEENALVAEHTEIVDEYQSIFYPDVQTSASDTTTGSHVGSIWGTLINGVRSLLGFADADGNGIDDSVQQNIIDKVQLSNLVIGEEYVLEGVLIDKETGEAVLIDGEEITQAVSFVVSKNGFTVLDGSAESSVVTTVYYNLSVDGYINLAFALDSSELEEGASLVVYESLYHNGVLVAQHKDIADEDQSIYDISVSTTAIEAATKDQIGVVGNSTIVDTVNMANLVAGEEYRIVGYIIDQETTTKDKIVYITDENEDIVSSTLTFTVSENDDVFVVTDGDLALDTNIAGYVELTFDITNEEVAGKAVTVVEEFYYNGELITVHGLSFDEDGALVVEPSQSIYYPDGHTNALSSGVHTADSSENTVISDYVYFDNLVMGETYTIVGTLHYQEDFTDSDGITHSAGDEVINSATNEVYSASVVIEAGVDGEDLVVSTLSDGTKVVSGYVLLDFEVDTSLFAGTTLIVFEEFEHNGVSVYVHANIDDEAQTIRIPSFGTTALFDNGINEISIYNEDGSYASFEIVDTIEYENLWTATTIPEDEYATYIVSGYLVDKETGEALIDNDGNEIVSYTVFTPEQEDGTVDVVYVIDASDFANEDGTNRLEGLTIVVFEDLYQINIAETSQIAYADIVNAVHVGEHKDIDDESQTIYFPEIGTSLSDTSGSKKIKDIIDITLIDIVSYENLQSGNTYILEGMLLNQETGEVAVDINGNEVVGTTEFVAGTDGSVDVEFTFNTESFIGNYVAVEYLYTEDGILVGVHYDLEDDAQTVEFDCLPPTGDNANMLSWLFVGCGALLAIIIFIIIYIKKKK